MKKLVSLFFMSFGVIAMKGQTSSQEKTGIVVMVSEDKSSGILTDADGEAFNFINPAGIDVKNGDAVGFKNIPIGAGPSGTTNSVGIPVGAGPSGTTSSIELHLPVGAGPSGTTSSITVPLGAGPSGTTSYIGIPVGAGPSGTTSDAIIIKKM